jgi:cell division protein FtsL
MTRKHVFIYAIAILFVVVLLEFNQKVNGPIRLIEHQIDQSEYESDIKNLQDSVKDLETKARILNNYLNMKHLEYIEVCDLVAKRKRK